MNKSENITELATALAKAQKAFLPIKRTEKVGYDTTKGRKQYNYAPLNEVIDAIRGALADNGLSVMQPTKVVDNLVYVETWLCHSSGQWVQSEMFVGEMNQLPQVEGSALTYKRRYSLSSLLGVASEDDDDAEITNDAEHPQVSQATSQDKSQHWCEKHNTAYKLNRRGTYGHYIGDTKEYCVEHPKQEKPAASVVESPQTVATPPAASVKAEAAPTSQAEQEKGTEGLTDTEKLLARVAEGMPKLKVSPREWLVSVRKFTPDQVNKEPVKVWAEIRDLIGMKEKEL